MKSKTIKGFKGFDKNLKCRDKQYEIGKTYEEKNAKICEEGMHFCENALDILSYYPISNGNRFAKVEGNGIIDKNMDGDTKVCSSNIKILGEVNLKTLIESGVKFISEKTKTSKNTKATTGHSAHSATTGDSAHSATTGNNCISAGLGIKNKAKAALGSWIVLAEWVQNNEDEWIISCVKTVKVDGEKILPDTYYSLINGEFIAEK